MSEGRALALAVALGRLLGSEVENTFGSQGQPRSKQRARAVRETFESLGPFYIKVGQLLSTRPDFVSADTIEELGALHDRVPAAPFSTFEEVLAAELGSRWRRYFRTIDVARPLGSASLAQVYAVTLADGRSAALKIQRPGIRPVVHADMAVLRRAAHVLARTRRRFDAVVDVHAMLDVLLDAMTGELDFTVEARNMDVGARAAEDFERLSVPEVLLATPRVLVQGMAPGRSIRDVPRTTFSPDDRMAIAHELLAYMYRCYFISRTFHADPHPGNIFVHADGTASLIDWGMIGRVDRPLSLKLALTLVNIVQNDGDGAAKAWIEMGKATEWADIEGFTGDVAILVPKAATASLEELNFGITLTTVLRHSTKRGIRTSPVVPMLGKSFANMEGSIRCLAPELSAAEVLRDELTDILMDLACEMFTQTYAARTALELMLAADNGLNQARGIVRDLSNREMKFTTNSETSSALSAGGSKYLVGAAGAAAVWRLRQRRR